MYIPEYVQKNKKLSVNEKYLYGLILENTHDDVCIKDNIFFSTFFGGSDGVSERTIRNYLKSLKDEGLIGIMDYGKIKGAIFVVNRQDLQIQVKNEDKNLQDASILEKFCQILLSNFQNKENNTQNNQNPNPINNILEDLNNLVLVSQENKINNIKKRACVREEIDNSNNFNKFSSYDIAGTPGRVRVQEYKQRQIYVNVLFKEFFNFYKSGPIYETGLEVVDNMIEALGQACTERGFVYDQVYHRDELLDIYLNITSDEFSSIVASVINKTANDAIDKRSPYIMGAIMNAGRLCTYQKANIQVKKGYPWNEWNPTIKEFSSLYYSIQQRVQRDRAFAKFKAEVNTC